MSTEAKDIVAAVAMIDANDKSQWDAAGVPKLKAVQTLVGDKTITAEQVAAALAPVAAVQAAPEPEPEVEVDLSTLDRNSPEYAAAVVKVARAAHTKLEAAISDQNGIRDAALETITQLRKEDDRHIRVIEQYGPKVSDAENVKRIQAQTIANLARQKDAALVVQSAMATSGTAIHPSKLDAALAARKRSPEQQANYAKFVHQRTAEQTAA